jgi:CRISPR-associated protein Cas2
VEEKVIISFDISDDRRRQRVVKVLEEYGVRKQYSLFELGIGEKALLGLTDSLESLMDFGEDRLMIIRLCHGCGERLYFKGEPCARLPEEMII